VTGPGSGPDPLSGRRAPLRRCRGCGAYEQPGRTDIRPAVLWRKATQGTRSEKGSLFVSRMLTAAVTCRRQGFRLLDFQERAILAHQLGEQPPSLLTLAQ
jgi:hypothetical protein